MKLIIKFIVIFLTFLCIVSCSKRQKENLLTVTSESANDIESEKFEGSILCDTSEVKSEAEEDLSDSNVSFPIIMFSNRELSAETTTTEGTLYLLEEKETTLEEYSVSCLYGKLDKTKGVKRDIDDNTFTYTISSNMEEDIITIQVYGKDGYKATNYVHVVKVINEKGMPVFLLKKNSMGIGNEDS